MVRKLVEDLQEEVLETQVHEHFLGLVRQAKKLFEVFEKSDLDLG